MNTISFFFIILFINFSCSHLFESFDRTSSIIDLNQINQKYHFFIESELGFLKIKILSMTQENENSEFLPLYYTTSSNFLAEWPKSESEDQIPTRQVAIEYYRVFTKQLKVNGMSVGNQIKAERVEKLLDFFYSENKFYNETFKFFRRPLYSLFLSNFGKPGTPKQVNYFEWNLNNKKRRYSEFVEFLLVFPPMHSTLESYLSQMREHAGSILPMDWLRICYKVYFAIDFNHIYSIQPKADLTLGSFGLVETQKGPTKGSTVMFVHAHDQLRFFGLKLNSVFDFHVEEDQEKDVKINSINLALPLLNHLGRFMGKESLVGLVNGFVSTVVKINIQDFSTFEMIEIRQHFQENSLFIEEIFQYLSKSTYVDALIKKLRRESVFYEVVGAESNPNRLFMQIIVFMIFEQTRAEAIRFFKHMIFEIHYPKIIQLYKTKSLIEMNKVVKDIKAWLKEDFTREQVSRAKYLLLAITLNHEHSEEFIEQIQYLLRGIQNFETPSKRFLHQGSLDSERFILDHFNTFTRQRARLDKYDDQGFIQRVKSSGNEKELMGFILEVARKDDLLL